MADSNQTRRAHLSWVCFVVLQGFNYLGRNRVIDPITTDYISLFLSFAGILLAASVLVPAFRRNERPPLPALVGLVLCGAVFLWWVWDLVAIHELAHTIDEST